jgi:uncharacterized damage-inducible protein DinB
MHPFYEAYIERLNSLHDSIKRAISDLPAEALDWSPGLDMNSLAILVVHLAGAERYWIGDVAGQIDSGRDRDAEFRASGLDDTTLAKQLDDTLAACREVLAGMTVEDLAAKRTSSRDGHTYTAAWALTHALEHTGLHLGHIQIIRQLWDQHLR